MKTRRSDYALIIALGCLLTLLIAAWWFPPAASADEGPNANTVTDVPTVVVPLRAVDGSVPHLVIVQATDRTWRARMAAKAWDRAVPGLDIRTGTCVPELPCIRVHVGTWSPEQALEVSGWNNAWAGLTTYPTPSTREVFLNRAEMPSWYVGRTRVASHEIGHALGLGHHDGQGVMGAWRYWEWRPTDAEADALALYYAGPFA